MDTLIVGEFQELCPEGIGKTPDGKGGAFFTFESLEIFFFHVHMISVPVVLFDRHQ